MSLLAKIVTFVVYAGVTGLISGAIGNAMRNPSDAGSAWLAFLAAGVVILAVISRRRRSTSAA